MWDSELGTGDDEQRGILARIMDAWFGFSKQEKIALTMILSLALIGLTTKAVLLLINH